MTGTELNEIKHKVIGPMIDDLICKYQLNNDRNKFEYIKECWRKLNELLIQYNFSDDTFKSLNIMYRKQIEDKINKLN